MTYMKENGKIVSVIATNNQRSFPRVIAARSGKQYCSQESDRKLRELIRGMDRHDQLIVLDELQKIYDPEKNDAVR